MLQEAFNEPTCGGRSRDSPEAVGKDPGLPLGPSGELPLDVHVEAVLEMPAIMWLLMQKPKTNAAVDKARAPGNPQPKPKNKPWSPPKGGKFDKNIRRLSKTPMPAQLRGGTPVDSDGKSICYGYNLGSCHDKQCKRGRHVCCRPGLFLFNAQLH